MEMRKGRSSDLFQPYLNFRFLPDFAVRCQQLRSQASHTSALHCAHLECA